MSKSNFELPKNWKELTGLAESTDDFKSRPSVKLPSGPDSVRIEKLEAALKKIAAIKNKSNGGDWDEIEEARDIAKQTLKK